jgi:hypothetical protein
MDGDRREDRARRWMTIGAKIVARGTRWRVRATGSTIW